jgi:hypothetical protein
MAASDIPLVAAEFQQQQQQQWWWCVCCIPSCNRMEKEKRVATSGSHFLITIR